MVGCTWQTVHGGKTGGEVEDWKVKEKAQQLHFSRKKQGEKSENT